MGAKSGAATLTAFTTQTSSTDRGSLARRVRKSPFTPLDPSGEEDRSAGWVEFEDHDRTDLAPSSFLFNQHLLLTWRIDQIRVPAARVRSQMEAFAREYREREGKPPGKSAKTEAKERIVKALRKRVLPTSKTVDVSWSFDTGRVWIWNTSERVLEEVVDILERELGLELHRLSPGARCELAGIEVESLSPTPELWGSDVAAEVKRHG